MKKIITQRRDQAVSGVIEALLLVALASIVLSTIQLTYVPVIMEQREAEHMDELSNQFSSLKAIIDIQSITQSTTPISSPITLGSRELPYFITARASGQLSITPDQFTIIVTPGLAGVSLDSITYEAFNSYFVDQIYILEGGGIIVKQPTGESVMRVDPAVSVENSTDITLNFYMYNIEGFAGKNLTNGYGKCFIRTNYSKSTAYTQFQDITSIKLYTKYTNAWNQSLHSIMGNEVDISEVPADNPVYVYITPKAGLGKTVNLDLEIIDLKAQVSPGYIK